MNDAITIFAICFFVLLGLYNFIWPDHIWKLRRGLWISLGIKPLDKPADWDKKKQEQGLWSIAAAVILLLGKVITSVISRK